MSSQHSGPCFLKGGLTRYVKFTKVDFISLRRNHKLPEYTFPVADPMAWKEDTLEHRWDYLDKYDFPSFPLICQVIHQLGDGINWSYSDHGSTATLRLIFGTVFPVS